MIAGILSISMSAIFIRWADAPGVVSAFYRMVIGSGLMFIPFVIQVRKNEDRLVKRGILFAILGGFFFSLDMLFWSSGVILSGATIPTILANTAPLWVGIGSWLIFREQKNFKFWIGLVIALFGASLVLGIDMSLATDIGKGAWYGILASFFYGAYHLASQRGREQLSTLNYFWISTSTTALCLFLYALFLRSPLIGYSPQTWMFFLLMGILVQVFGWMFINFAHGNIPASIVSPTLLVQPLMTAFFAYTLLQESPKGWHLLGGSLIISGVFLVHQSKILSSQGQDQ